MTDTALVSRTLIRLGPFSELHRRRGYRFISSLFFYSSWKLCSPRRLSSSPLNHLRLCSPPCRQPLVILHSLFRVFYLFTPRWSAVFFMTCRKRILSLSLYGLYVCNSFLIVQLQGGYGRKKKKKEVRCCIMLSNTSYIIHNTKVFVYKIFFSLLFSIFHSIFFFHSI